MRFRRQSVGLCTETHNIVLRCRIFMITDSHTEPYPRLPASDQLCKDLAVFPFPFGQFLKHHTEFPIR